MGAAGRQPRVLVDPGRPVRPVSRLLSGANHRYLHAGFGLWDPQRGAPRAGFLEQARPLGLTLLRFPGGTVANLYDWRRAVGPVAQRRRTISGLDGAPADTECGLAEHLAVTS